MCLVELEPRVELQVLARELAELAELAELDTKRTYDRSRREQRGTA